MKLPRRFYIVDTINSTKGLDETGHAQTEKIIIGEGCLLSDGQLTVQWHSKLEPYAHHIGMKPRNESVTEFFNTLSEFWNIYNLNRSFQFQLFYLDKEEFIINEEKFAIELQKNYIEEFRRTLVTDDGEEIAEEYVQSVRITDSSGNEVDPKTLQPDDTLTVAPIGSTAPKELINPNDPTRLSGEDSPPKTVSSPMLDAAKILIEGLEPKGILQVDPEFPIGFSPKPVSKDEQFVYVTLRNASNEESTYRYLGGNRYVSPKHDVVYTIPNLLELRSKAALTQTELAERVGCSRQLIIRVEQGRTIEAASYRNIMFCLASALQEASGWPDVD